MNSDSNFEPEPEPSECQAIATTVRAFAQRYQKDSLALLTLLRRLEELHREIRDGVFQSSLPDDRQGLYKLLKDIEAKGGWPRIERMNLESLLTRFEAKETDDGAQVAKEQ